MRAALSTCSRMHAFFWPGAKAREPHSGMAKEIDEAVWDAGTYWMPAKQAATQIDDIPARCEPLPSSVSDGPSPHTPWRAVSVVSALGALSFNCCPTTQSSWLWGGLVRC